MFYSPLRGTKTTNKLNHLPVPAILPLSFVPDYLATLSVSAICPLVLSVSVSTPFLVPLCAFLWLPLPKDRGTHSHHRRSFFYCDFKVVCHPHRQLPAAFTKQISMRKFVAQFPEPAKVWSCLFRSVKEWRQSHQPDQFKPLKAT
jgi:hypothetical protein